MTYKTQNTSDNWKGKSGIVIWVKKLPYQLWRSGKVESWELKKGKKNFRRKERYTKIYVFILDIISGSLMDIILVIFPFFIIEIILGSLMVIILLISVVARCLRGKHVSLKLRSVLHSSVWYNIRCNDCVELENGVNIQVNGVAVQMDGGWLHVIVFTQYLCASMELNYYSLAY